MGCHKCGAENVGYTYGFCDPCTKSILSAARLRLRRKPAESTDKKLRQDIERAEYAIECCSKALKNPFFSGPEMDVAIRSEITRLQRAIAEPWRLWAIYRRTDKTAPYAIKPVAVAEPVSVVPAEGEEKIAA